MLSFPDSPRCGPIPDLSPSFPELPPVPEEDSSDRRRERMSMGYGVRVPGLLGPDVGTVPSLLGSRLVSPPTVLSTSNSIRLRR